MFNIFNLFKRKKEEVSVPATETAVTTVEKPEEKQAAPLTTETSSTESIKPHIDLILARIEGIKLQYDTLSERLDNIEKMVKEIYDLAKS